MAEQKYTFAFAHRTLWDPMIFDTTLRHRLLPVRLFPGSIKDTPLLAYTIPNFLGWDNWVLVARWNESKDTSGTRERQFAGLVDV